MNQLVVIMDMNVGFAKSGSLYSPRTEAKINPIGRFCRQAKADGAKVIALSDTHSPSDHEFTVFPPHCLAGTGEPEVVPELAPLCDAVIPKYTTGGFFEVQDYLKMHPIFDWNEFDEIVIVGCCTDLCVLNFAIITQKYLENEYHAQRSRHVPQIIIPMNLVETYDAPGHNADEINRFYAEQYTLHGIKVLHE